MSKSGEIVMSNIISHSEFEIKEVEFENSIIAVIKNTITNKLYVGIKYICMSLGLDISTQFKKMQENEVLAMGMGLSPIPSPNGIQMTKVLELDFLPLWLAGININRVSDEVKPKLIQFQLKAKDVLAEAFVSKKDISKMSRLELLNSYQEMLVIAIEQEKEIQFLKHQNELKAKMLEKYRIEFDEGLVYVTQVSNEFGIGPIKFSNFLKKLLIVSDVEKTVYEEYTHLFKYTEKYNTAKNDFIKILKVNMDGVVLLIELITNGIETISKSNGVHWTSADFDKLSRKEIPEFVDNNSAVFDSILDRYKLSKISTLLIN